MTLNSKIQEMYFKRGRSLLFNLWHTFPLNKPPINTGASVSKPIEIEALAGEIRY